MIRFILIISLFLFSQANAYENIYTGKKETVKDLSMSLSCLYEEGLYLNNGMSVGVDIDFKNKYLNDFVNFRKDSDYFSLNLDTDKNIAHLIHNQYHNNKKYELETKGLITFFDNDIINITFDFKHGTKVNEINQDSSSMDFSSVTSFILNLKTMKFLKNRITQSIYSNKTKNDTLTLTGICDFI